MKKILLVIAALSLGGCVAQQKVVEKPPAPPPTMGWDGFAEATAPGVWLGGQPSEEALDEFQARGGRLVINLRTDEEMSFYPYYEHSLAGRGLTYVRIPTTGAELDAAEYRALENTLSHNTGPVMLHCASGTRATYLWAMKRMADEGIDSAQAEAWCDQRRGKVWEKGHEILEAFDAEGAR